MAASDEWRWTDEQGVQRVVRADELRSALASSVLAPSTLVWREGMTGWVPAFTVPELGASDIIANPMSDPSTDGLTDVGPPPRMKPGAEAAPGPVVAPIQKPAMVLEAKVRPPGLGSSADTGRATPTEILDEKGAPLRAGGERPRPAAGNDASGAPLKIAAAPKPIVAPAPRPLAGRVESASKIGAPRVGGTAGRKLDGGKTRSDEDVTRVADQHHEPFKLKGQADGGGQGGNAHAATPSPGLAGASDGAKEGRVAASLVSRRPVTRTAVLSGSEAPRPTAGRPASTVPPAMPVIKRRPSSVPPPLPVTADDKGFRTTAFRGSGSSAPAAGTGGGISVPSAPRLPSVGRPMFPMAEHTSTDSTGVLPLSGAYAAEPKQMRAAAPSFVEGAPAFAERTPSFPELSAQGAAPVLIGAAEPQRAQTSRSAGAAALASYPPAPQPMTGSSMLSAARGQAELQAQAAGQALPRDAGQGMAGQGMAGQPARATLRSEPPPAQGGYGPPRAPMRSTPPPAQGSYAPPPALAGYVPPSGPSGYAPPPALTPSQTSEGYSAPPPALAAAAQGDGYSAAPPAMILAGSSFPEIRATGAMLLVNPRRAQAASDPPPGEVEVEAAAPPPGKVGDPVTVPISSLFGAGGMLIGMAVMAFFMGRCSAGPGPQSAPPRAALGTLPRLARVSMPAPPKPCWMAKQPVRWAPAVLQAVPVDVAPTASGVVVAYARDTREPATVEVDFASGTFAEKAADKRDGDLVRVLAPREGAALLSTTKADEGPLVPYVFAPGASPFVIGVAGRGSPSPSVAVADKPDGAPATLWTLPAIEEDKGLEAARVLASGPSKYALVFRRAGNILGGFVGEGRKAEGGLGVVAGSGGSVGKPSLGTNKREVAVVFADKATAESPWEIRVGHAALGQMPRETIVVPLPKGGPGGDAFAPDVAGIADGRWVLVWTEGKSGGYAVRAQTFGADFKPLGDPIAISPPAGNFGQAVVGVAGNYVTTMFLSKAAGSGYELWGAVLQCGS